jgi:hypothetical protein
MVTSHGRCPHFCSGGKNNTYVACTSSFAGTGGIVDAVELAEAMVGVVACSGALFEGDFLRERKPIVGVVWKKVWMRSSFCRQVCG